MIPIISTLALYLGLKTLEVPPREGEKPKAPTPTLKTPPTPPTGWNVFTKIPNILHGLWKHLTTEVHDLSEQIPWVHQNLSEDAAERAAFNCLDATRKMFSLYFDKMHDKIKSLYPPSSYSFYNNELLYTNVRKYDGRLQVNSSGTTQVLEITASELLAGRPVPAVVSYRNMRGADRTNHWVLISGMERDLHTGQITKLYFLDPGTLRAHRNKGELAINEEGLPVGKSPFKGQRIYELSGIAVRNDLRKTLRS